MEQNETKSCKKVAPTFVCEDCDYYASKKSSFDKHLATHKHEMKQNETKVAQKVAPKFVCENCNYETLRKNNLDKHILTAKHNLLQKVAKSCSKVAHENPDVCPCGIEFKSRTTLWRHKKYCDFLQKEDTIPDINAKEIIDALIKITQNGTANHSYNNNNNNNNNTNNNNNNTNNNNTNNTISNNKTFNLNFFLNETCKNAMNISDFVKSVQVELDDLEYTGRQGYVQGISNIIVKNLNKLEQNLRPLHCSDSKREVIYIKNNDEWTKETKEKPILTNAIKIIANENIKQIMNWKNKYTDCTKSNSTKNDLYLKIVSNSMNGLTQEEGNKNVYKIISNVAKEVTIDKTI